MNKITNYFRTNLTISLVLLVCLISSLTLFKPRFLRINYASENLTSTTPSEDSPHSHPDSKNSGLDSPDSKSDSDNSETTPPESESPQTPVTTFHFSSDLVFRAVNPGYTIDGVRDVGEFIELQKTTDVPKLSLAGYLLRYTNSSGTSTTLYQFPENSHLVSESLLFRYAKSPDYDQSDATYMTTIALSSGRLELVKDDEVVDYVCWPSKTSDCVTAFKSSKPTTLVRDSQTGTFSHQTSYNPTFDLVKPSLIIPASPDTPSSRPSLPSLDTSSSESPSSDSSNSASSNQNSSNPAQNQTPSSNSSNDQGSSTDSSEVSARCYGVEFSELLSYYSDSKDEQYIELYNTTDHAIQLDHCSLRYKKKLYPLFGEIAANNYRAYYSTKFNPSLSLTKNPTSSGTLELLDSDNRVIDSLIYNHGQKKSTSFAKFFDADGEAFWNLTYQPTPGAENVYQEFRSCPAGKTVNPSTGNCVKIIASGTTESATCPAGKYRNPLTGRCKNIESETTLKPCATGYERNPNTGRCRKIKIPNDGADYALVPLTESESSTHFVAFGIVILLVSIGLIYIILQFRHDIARATRKARQRLHHIRKNLVSRGISFHRHK